MDPDTIDDFGLHLDQIEELGNIVRGPLSSNEFGEEVPLALDDLSYHCAKLKTIAEDILFAIEEG